MRSTVAVLGIAVALVAGARFLRQQHRAGSPTAPAVVAPIVLGATTSPARSLVLPRARSAPEREAHPPVRPAPAGSTVVARRFLAAYLIWQDGSADRHDLRALRASATPALWRLLKSNRGQPTPNPRVGAEHLQRLASGVAGPGTASILADLHGRSGLQGGLSLVLRRMAGRWQVVWLGR
jgi:hypothetical protein